MSNMAMPLSLATPRPPPEFTGSSRGSPHGGPSRSNSTSTRHNGHDQLEDDLEHDDEQGAGKKRKRNRQALSCTECKRRKIKCDRLMPCSSCAKRGEESLCTWDAAPKAVQPFALRSELEDIRDLIAELHPQAAARIEELRKRAASTSARAALEARGVLPEHDTDLARTGDAIARQMMPFAIGTIAPGEDGASKQEPDSDTEEAANTLEDLAMGRMPGNPMEALAANRAGGRIGGQASQPNAPAVPWPEETRRPGTNAETTAPSENVRGPGNWHLNVGETTLLLDRPLDSLLNVTVFRSVLSSVPSNALLDMLVSRFIGDAALFTPVPVPTFLSELGQFKAVRDTPAADTIDPAWLALLFTIIALGIEGGEHTPETLTLRLSVPLWRDAIALCLSLAEWTSVPRYRVILALALHVPIRVQTPLASSNALATYLNTSFRHAVSLGWHRLGDDPTVMPGADNDPGLPRGPCAMRRQAVLLLWSSLAFATVVMSSQKKGSDATTFNHEDANTQLPYNVNDQDLIGDSITVREQPSSVVTDASMERLKRIICEHASRVRVLFADPNFSYDRLLQLEKMTRSRAADLGPLQRGKTPPLIAMMTSGVLNQILRMHRPWLARGYRDSRYSHSTKTCIECAKSIIEAARVYGEKGRSLWFLVRHNVGAIIILALHLFHIIDHSGSSQAEIDGLFVDLDDTARWLSLMCDVGPPQNRPAALSGIRIITNMRKGAQQRLALIGQGKRPRESIAAVVKRIAAVVHAEEGVDLSSPSELTPGSSFSPNVQAQSSMPSALPQPDQPLNADVAVDPMLFLNAGAGDIPNSDFMADLFSCVYNRDADH